MILSLVRIPLTVLYGYWLYKLTLRYPGVSGGDMIFLMGYGLVGAIVVAVLWAPVVGEKLSDPLTSTFTHGTSLPPDANRLVQEIGRLQHRGYHRFALLLVFIEGIRHPNLPQAALLGLRSARPGSFLEKCFAKEVYQYNNIQNCLHAYTILKERHRTIPRLHAQPEVNLAISSLTRPRPPEAAVLPLKPAGPCPAPQRNPRITLPEP